jgi:N-glycosylase/DNA lyase
LELKGKVRFHNTKAQNVVLARRRFVMKRRTNIRGVLSRFDDPKKTREWMVSNIRGLGYKEASHFLRNIGLGEDLAILDRHILKNLVALGVLKEIPSSLSRKRYLEIEDEMADFARTIRIPMAHLDLLLWYKETGEIFK